MPQNATPKLNLRFKCNEHSSYIKYNNIEGPAWSECP